MESQIRIGIVARLFPTNYRPALQEIDFVAKNHFKSIQFPGHEGGLKEEFLGSKYAELTKQMSAKDITPVMEIVARVNVDGKTKSNTSPRELVMENIPAIKELKCERVHLHIVPQDITDSNKILELEKTFTDDLREIVKVSKDAGFIFGLEHNEPELMMFATPEKCKKALAEVEGLGFIWDFNHTPNEYLADYISLAKHMSMLHVSDTPLPETNYHLPIGMGNINFKEYFKKIIASGYKPSPVILEVGGLPKSGGYGRDTDIALIESLQKLTHEFSLGLN